MEKSMVEVGVPVKQKSGLKLEGTITNYGYRDRGQIFIVLTPECAKRTGNNSGCVWNEKHGQHKNCPKEGTLEHCGNHDCLSRRSGLIKVGDAWAWLGAEDVEINSPLTGYINL